jgi:beta-lactamase regulating signal transducer with metallopeptidase domain
MTATDCLVVFLRVNLALVAVLGGLIVLRGPVRRHCGSDAVYGLWMASPIAMVVMSAPHGLAQGVQELLTPSLSVDLIKVWLAGAGLSLAGLVVAQIRLMAKARRGEVGPAVLGLLRPRIYLPSDFEARFTPAERAVIWAHERAHMLRGDPRANAIMALIQIALWFNPATYLAIRLFREDQEMACDHSVMAEIPERRRLYAETMLKSQEVHWSPALGCAWGRHPLEHRVEALTLVPTITRLITIRLLICGAAVILIYQACTLYFPEASTGFAFVSKANLINLPQLSPVARTVATAL